MITQKKRRVNKMNKEIYLGLDIGTNSCGYAVTDGNYNLVRIAGHDAWGVRLFEEAQTAKERRINRATRRRIVRKKLQNNWLQELFKSEVEKVDPSFFTRLKFSNLDKEDKEKSDKNLTSKYSLFNDMVEEIFTDKQYYDKYKTVYHLRKSLLTNPAEDIRLLYLAVHSILTHRGHFLYETDFSNNQSNDTLKADFVSLLEKLKTYGEENFDAKSNLTLTGDKVNCVMSLIKDFDDGLPYKQIKENFETELGVKTKLDKTLASILISGKFKTSDIFDVDKEDAIKIDFNDANFEEQYGEIISSLKDVEVEILTLLQAIYANIQLKKLLGENNYICQAMVERYEKHNKQLQELKKFVKTYFPSKKKIIFNAGHKPSKNGKNENKENTQYNNYAAYCYSDLYSGKKRVLYKKSSQEDFYKFLKSELFECDVENNVELDKYEERKQNILNAIEKNDFLLKLRSNDNILLPNSLYQAELKQILKVSAQKFNFLNNKDADGRSVSQKIIDVVSFRVPYFVGPIGESDNGWIRKDKSADFKPWTLDKIIDLDEAENRFIQNMTNKCTYLPTEDVLAQKSLLYSKFRVLNELNNLKINGNAIAVETKQQIFDGLFKKTPKVSTKKLVEFLKQNNIINKNDSNVVFTGIDKEFANDYSSYVTFATKFGEEFVNKNLEVFEKIIKYHTIISDKSRLAKRIKREFNIFSDEDIKFLKSLNFSGWGSLSQKFLEGLKFSDKKSASPEMETLTVMSALWETNKNLQEIIFCKTYDLQQKLDANIQKIQRDLLYDDIQNMYTSPAVKRGTWQAISIINELKSKLGKYPDKIFVEVTRNNQEKGEAGRKDSRHKMVVKKYKDKQLKLDCQKLCIEFNKLMEELNQKDNSNLRSEKLYLYFMQLGKDIYTGKPIDISQLNNDNMYNVDHIIPRCKVKDDSIDNKVLVSAAANLAKSDNYPVDGHIQASQKAFWELLRENGLMTDSKLARLQRTEEFTEKDADNFTNQQLVSTNQESKAVIDLLSKVYSNKRNIIFSKAMFVSDFRKNFNINKSRNVNALHHAQDAYLNVVVGNVLFNRFTEGYWKKNTQENNNQTADKNANTTSVVEKLFRRTVWSNQTGEVVWKGQPSIDLVRKNCEKNSPCISIMPYENKNGMFYNATVYKSSKNHSATPASFALKAKGPLSSIDKYGGYNSLKNAYFIAVESVGTNGTVNKTIETVPIIVEYQYRNDANKTQKIIDYIEKTNNIKITKVIKDKIKYRSLLKIDGGLYMLTAKTNDSLKLLKLNQWFLSNKDIGYIKILEKYQNMPATIKELLKTTDEEIIVSPAVKTNSKQLAISRTNNVYLYDLIVAQLGKKIYSLSSISGLVKKLTTARSVFLSLSISAQAELLLGLVKYVGGAYTVDLTLLGEKKQAGSTRIGKNISNLNISLIEQSVTGLYAKETVL